MEGRRRWVGVVVMWQTCATIRAQYLFWAKQYLFLATTFLTDRAPQTKDYSALTDRTLGVRQILRNF